MPFWFLRDKSPPCGGDRAGSSRSRKLRASVFKGKQEAETVSWKWGGTVLSQSLPLVTYSPQQPNNTTNWEVSKHTS